MAEFNNEKLGVRFTIPDAIPVRKQLAFRSDIAFAPNKEKLERYWVNAVELIDEWECELIPNPNGLKLSDDSITDGKITDIMNYVGNATAGHMYTIGAVPKND